MSGPAGWLENVQSCWLENKGLAGNTPRGGMRVVQFKNASNNSLKWKQLKNLCSALKLWGKLVKKENVQELKSWVENCTIRLKLPNPFGGELLGTVQSLLAGRQGRAQISGQGEG